jgi:hypothetical protein
MRRVGSRESVPVGVRSAGVRKNFYRRTRPQTGEPFYDVEWSLAQAEDAALPIVRQLSRRWPLDWEDKGKVETFFALQHLRGPAFKAWHEAHVASMGEALRADPVVVATPPAGMSPEEAVERYIEHLMSDTYRAVRMFGIVRAVGTLFASMHWTLVEFANPCLVTSDHPVVVWPLGRGPERPRANDLSAGVVDTLEVFVPVGPASLLLMTWLNDEDPREPIRGEGRHMSTANAFVIANADKQWFHEPEVAPWVAKGVRDPLSADLVDHYGYDVAQRSQRRQEADAHAQAVIEAGLSNDPIPMVTVSRVPPR